MWSHICNHGQKLKGGRGGLRVFMVIFFEGLGKISLQICENLKNCMYSKKRRFNQKYILLGTFKGKGSL
jgi:hypothetical protein